MKIWLDDQIFDPNAPDRATPTGWVGVQTAKEAIRLLKNNHVEEIDLDHDLGGSSWNNGHIVLKYIQKKCFLDDTYNPPKIRIHTANSSEMQNMRLTIESINRILANRPK